MSQSDTQLVMMLRNGCMTSCAWMQPPFPGSPQAAPCRKTVNCIHPIIVANVLTNSSGVVYMQVTWCGRSPRRHPQNLEAHSCVELTAIAN